MEACIEKLPKVCTFLRDEWRRNFRYNASASVDFVNQLIPGDHCPVPRLSLSSKVHFVAVTGVLSLIVLSFVFSTSLINIGYSSAVSTGDWTMFNFDYNNSRYNPASAITSANVGSIKLKWSFPTAPTTSEPVVSNGVVYFDDWDGNVYALNLASGSTIWKTKVGGNMSASLTLSNGVLYGGLNPYGPVPQVFALNAANGALNWKVTITHTNMTSVWASPVIYQNLVIVGIAGYGKVETNTSKAGEVVALSSSNGAMLWSYKTTNSKYGGAAVWGSVALDPTLGYIYFGTGNSYTRTTPKGSTSYAYSIICLNALTGAKVWSYTAHKYDHDYDFGSSPNLFLIPNHNAIGLGGKDGYYYVLDRVTGALLHKYQLSSGSPQGITGVAGFDYTTSSTAPELFLPVNTGTSGKCCSNIMALLPATSKVAWSFKSAGAQVVGSVTVIPGAVLFGDTGGNVYALSTTNGAVLFHTLLPSSIGSGITASGGMVLVTVGTPGYTPLTTSGLYAYG
jgi:polyvinyl alcohol dehydrogenase (cytochrome)